MKRTPLRERVFPDYTRGEETFNMVSHIVGAAIAIAITVLCIIMGASHHNAWAVVSGAIYGSTMVIMFTVSSIYHGLHENMGKQVMRVIDHCDIYCLIAGTYTPFLLVSLSGRLGWMFFYIIWGLTIIGIILNAIDLRRFSKVSAYINVAMGWLIIFSFRSLVKAVDRQGIILLLAGGIIYSIGAILYGLGSKVRYMHSVWHFFVLGGTICHFFSIYLAVL